jgi:hypothetical protein
MNNNPDQDGSFAPLSSEEQKTSEEPKTIARLELFQLLTSNWPPPRSAWPPLGAAADVAKSAGLVSIDHIFGACEERLSRSNDFAAPLSRPACPCSEDAN